MFGFQISIYNECLQVEHSNKNYILYKCTWMKHAGNTLELFSEKYLIN